MVGNRRRDDRLIATIFGIRITLRRCCVWPERLRCCIWTECSHHKFYRVSGHFERFVAILRVINAGWVGPRERRQGWRGENPLARNVTRPEGPREINLLYESVEAFYRRIFTEEETDEEDKEQGERDGQKRKKERKKERKKKKKIQRKERTFELNAERGRVG